MFENQPRLRRALAIGRLITRGLRRLEIVVERCVWRILNRPIKCRICLPTTSGIVAASPATIPSETAQLQQLLVEAKENEREARRALGVLASIIKHLPVGVTVQAEDGKPLFANDMAAEFSGLARTLRRKLVPSSGEGASVQASASAVTMTEDRVAGAAGERTLLKYCRPARIHDRAVLVTAAIDHTERKQAEVELSRRAYFDDLTRLPNRTLIQEHVEQLLTSAEMSPRFALAFLDIDNFKHINDYYTHAIGDALLVKVAQRIATNVRPSDILSRISGDEFLWSCIRLPATRISPSSSTACWRNSRSRS